MLIPWAVIFDFFAHCCVLRTQSSMWYGRRSINICRMNIRMNETLLLELLSH